MISLIVLFSFMTTKVALQATKRRKMGYDVDFLDDSGVPMDGIELDSSSSNTTGSVTTGSASHANAIHHRPTNNEISNANNSATNDNNNVSNSQNRNNHTAENSSQVTTNQNSSNNTIASTTNSTSTTATPAISSTPLRELYQAPPSNDNQVTSEQSNETSQSPLMNMTNNEAMTSDDPSMLTYANDDSALKFVYQDSPDYGQSQNDHRMAEDSSPSYEEREQSSTNGIVIVGGAKKAKEKSIIRSFGDLFDDDDLD